MQSGSNFLSSLITGRMAAIRDEEGYIFIDRNGANFEIILDYLRNGILLIPPNVPLKAVVVEAQYYSISLETAFLGDLKDGVYGDLHSGQRTSIIYAERSKEEPWIFGFTGVITSEDDGKKVSTFEFWREIGFITEGRIHLRNYVISHDNGDLKFVQTDRMNRPFLLKFISPLLAKKNHSPHVSSSRPTAKHVNKREKEEKKDEQEETKPPSNTHRELTDEWWVGDRFVDGVSVGNYVHLAIANLEDDKWVCHIRCDKHKTMAVQQFEFLTDHFFVVKGAFGIGFWIFYHREAERLLTFNPYYSKDQEGHYMWFNRGWMRFMKDKSEQLH